MNDQFDAQAQHEHLAGQVSRTLGAAGDALEITTDPAAIKQRGATRQRRRRGLYGVAVVSVFALGAGALLWAVGGDDASVATVDEDVPEVTDEEFAVAPATNEVDEPDQAADIDEADESEAALDEAVQPAPATSSAASSDSDVASDVGPGMFDGTLVPWQNGFLNIGVQQAPQPLPEEFTDAVSEVFPQEVRDLFADGLPATIEEATAMLSEAGLLDEVADVLAENPEANEAVFASERPAPTSVAHFTTDGESWETIETTIPIEGYLNVTAAGGAIVVWSVEEPDYGPLGQIEDPDGVRSMTVARTFDLVSWEVTEVDIPTPVSDQPHVSSHVWVQSLAATPTGWVALVTTERMVNHDALLPDELPFDAAAGYGVGESDDGIEVEFWNEETESWDVIIYTWDELGVDPAGFESFREPGVVQLITGDFDGTSTIAESPLDVGHINQLAATGAGVVAIGDGVYVSDDLRSWQPVLGLPDEMWISSAAPVDGGTLLTGEDRDGPRGWLLADDATLTEISMPQLPNQYSLWNQGTSAAWVVELMDEYNTWEPTTVVIEHDGMSIELTDGPDGQQALVTDVSTGEIVLDHAWGYDDTDGQQIYEANEETGEVSIVLRNQAGDEIVRIPGDVLEDAYRNQRPPPGEEMMTAEEMPTPDFWLMATTDGVDWLVQDLDDPNPDGPGFWPGRAAINGDRVLYQTNTGWTLTTT